MKNKKSSRGHKSVFLGDKPSPQRYYPTTPNKQIADMVLKDVKKGNLESGVQLLKKDLFKGKIEKDLEYIKSQIGGGYAIEEFIERGFW